MPLPPEHIKAVRRHTTRVRTELDNIIKDATLLRQRLDSGYSVDASDADRLVRSSVTVANRLAILETLCQVAEWQVPVSPQHHLLDPVLTAAAATWATKYRVW